MGSCSISHDGLGLVSLYSQRRSKSPTSIPLGEILQLSITRVLSCIYAMACTTGKFTKWAPADIIPTPVFIHKDPHDTPAVVHQQEIHSQPVRQHLGRWSCTWWIWMIGDAQDAFHDVEGSWWRFLHDYHFNMESYIEENVGMSAYTWLCINKSNASNLKRLFTWWRTIVEWGLYMLISPNIWQKTEVTEKLGLTLGKDATIQPMWHWKENFR